MAAKPTAPARWAETAGGTPAANISVPSSGQRDTGWTNGQVPPAGIQNAWQAEVYQWLKYVADAVFTGPVQVVGDLDVTDTLTVANEVTITSGDLVMTAGDIQTNAIEGSNITATGFVETSEGDIRHGVDFRAIPALDANIGGTDFTVNLISGQLDHYSTDGDPIGIGIPVADGESLVSIRVNVRHVNTADRFSARLFSRKAGVVAPESALVSSAGVGVAQGIVLAGITPAVADLDDVYWVVITPIGTGVFEKNVYSIVAGISR